MFKTTQSQRSC